MIPFITVIGITICHCQQTTIEPIAIPTIQSSVNPTNAPTITPCTGSNKRCYYKDITPNISGSVSATINIRSIDGSGSIFTYYTGFSVKNRHCINPRISVYYRDTEFNSLYVYYNNNKIGNNCGSGSNTQCSIYRYCPSQNYTISGLNVVKAGTQFVLSLVKGSGTNLYCNYTLWANVQLICDKYVLSSSPTNKPTQVTELSFEPTTLPSKYPSLQPSTQPTSNPTDIPTIYPTNYPTNYPSKAPTATQILALSALNQDGECENPAEAISRYDYISLSECIELCESVIWNDCIMIQYYDKLQSNDDSRCYIFDKICYLSQHVDKRVNSSYIYYRNQLIKQYCVDYRDWTDKYTDDCNAYVTHGLCINGTMTDNATLDEFEEAKDPIYGWTALDVCCECGGGKSVYDNIAVSFVNEYNYDDKLAECSFKEDIINTTDLARWNNFALFQLMEGINHQFYKQYPLNNNLFIYTDLLENDNNHSYTLIICDFSFYDIHATLKELYTDFFIFGSIEFDQQSVYFINSEYFEIDLIVLSDVIKVQYRDYRYCNSEIEKVSTEDTAVIDMILPCFYQYVASILVTTTVPDITTVVKEPETFWEKYVYPVDEGNWTYWVITGAALCILITFCLWCCVRKQKRKQHVKSKQMQTQIEIAPSSTKLIVDTQTNSTHTVSTVFIEEVEEKALDDLTDHDDDDDDDDEIDVDEKIEILNDEEKEEKHGLLVFQLSWYTEEQMEHIYNQYNTKKESMKAPKMLFGENDIDKFREINVSRQYFGGQAIIMGIYDTSIAYGIVTTFYKCKLPKIGEFNNLMDTHFQPLQQHLLNGYDVIIPIPTKNDILRNKKEYFKDGKQKIFHNLGTGISQLPFEYIEYIQFKIDELKEYARNIKTVKYYNYSPNISLKSDVITQINKGHIIYQCPLCCESVHYLMKFKNCKHSVCEQCLRNYIIQHLDYLENHEEYRFKCWATKISKCQNGQICLEDVNISNDKCQCEQCKKNNIDTGNGTILDDESYKQFKHIMIAFGTKSQWDTDECPNCKKPFPIPREWREKPQSVTNGYYYGQKTIFFVDVIDENKCNCCGKQIGQYQNNNDDDGEMKEIAITAYKTHNNCTVCKHYYCDDCRSNCFYEIERDFTIRPPTPIGEAMIDFNTSQKLRRREIERNHKNENKKNIGYKTQPFECCEICWYTFYCRKCPHCNCKFCGMCDAKWNGSTANWSDKIKQKQDLMIINDNEDDEKYGGDNLYKLIDEKNGRHDAKSHHSCNEEILKAAEIEKKKKKTREQKKNEQLKIIQNRLQDSETRNKSIQREMIQKEKKYDKVKQEKQELITKNKDIQRELLEVQNQNECLKNTILELQKAKLIKEKEITEIEKLKIIKEKEEVNSEKEKYKKIAEEKEKQRMDLQKQLFVRVWQWKDNNPKWIQYDDDISKKIEELKHFESVTFSVANNNQSYKVIRTGDAVGKQINMKTNISRQIRRIEQDRGYIQYPKWWNVERLQLNDNNDYAKPQLINMNLNDDKAKDIANSFYNTSKHRYPNMKITKIESVENQRLYDKYWNERSILKKSIGENQLNERYLWHGTGTEDTMETIEKQGFRKEYSSTALWGKGTYFAVYSGYSVGYSSNNNGIYKMFQCKVICGESIIGNKSYELKTWPKKSNGLIYDSLNSKHNDIYVIHDDVRAYPMFVITFKTN